MQKNDMLSCVCRFFVVILQPKIYVGGICLFVRVDFQTY